MPDLEDDVYDDRDEGAEADYNNLVTVISVEQAMRGFIKGNYIIYTTFVKNKREKDKIETKPDQIKKKGSVEKPESVEDQSQLRKQKRRRKYRLKRPIMQTLKMY
nr:hypothetical protein [Tanacetum cinerariifolium]